MNTFTKAAILGTVALATLTSSFAAASAEDRFWQRHAYHDRGWHHHGYRDGAVAAGVLGLTAGVLLGGALSEPEPSVVYEERPIHRREVVVEDGPVYDDEEYVEPVQREYIVPRRTTRVIEQTQDDDSYYPARPQKRIVRNTDVAQQQTLEPWTAKWRTYCKQRFSSFNATTGTYQGYDGKSHFCTAG